MEINFEQFEVEARRLTELYKNLNLRGGARNVYNVELLMDIIEILQQWERINILWEIDPPIVNAKTQRIKKSIDIQLKALKVLELIYEETYA